MEEGWALASWQRSESSHRRRESWACSLWWLGARRFFVDIWGLAESLVPAYTSSSIFCEKLRSGDAGERDSVSGERGSSSGVSGDCDVLSWLPRLFSRKSSLGVESWSCCNMSQSACDELCGRGSAGMSMSNACFGCVALSVSLWDSSTT